MDFKNLVSSRFSCRKFKPEMPDDKLILQVLDIARLAPSASNKQPWKFIVVKDPQLLEKVKSTYSRPWIESAPLVIVVCGNHEKSWKRYDGKDHCDIDVAITIDHLTLAASDKGLATCWICMFESRKVEEILETPENWEAIALIPIGYPDVEPDVNRHSTLRKPIEEIVSFNKF